MKKKYATSNRIEEIPNTIVVYLFKHINVTHTFHK